MTVLRQALEQAEANGHSVNLSAYRAAVIGECPHCGMGLTVAEDVASGSALAFRCPAPAQSAAGGAPIV